ncbi:membrane metallo-endopeptidase-like 1 [Drosophila biarmipes]|uniref:membrane metallo-endopeptidase-like 1 n=1 Tax=Drosophila biarmipes TaxID=125945 RepID=UPI0007E7B250|nr:membrane metallo-endopeptidase-like 1 [Drosophila biarmipes]
MRFELRWMAILLGSLLTLGKTEWPIDPCQNFYKAACGNWSTIHAEDPYSSLVEQLDFDYQEKLAELLENEEQVEEPRFLQLLRDFYASCRRPLTKDQVLGFLERLIEMPSLGEEELTVGLTAAFRVGALLDLTSFDLEKIWQALLFRTEDWNPNETNREPLTGQKFDLLWAGGLGGADLRRDIFWQELSWLESQVMNTSSNEASDGAPAYWMLPWPEFRPDYRRLARLLANKSKRFILTYIYLRLKLVHGPGESWRIGRAECADHTRQILTHPSVWLVERSHPRLGEESVLQDIFQELKHRFGQRLRANRNNFSKQTQQFLLSKLDRMTLRLSVLPRRCSERSLEQRINRHYEDVHLSPTDYFGNLLVGLKHSRMQRDQYDLLSMISGPASRNSLYPVRAYQYGTYASPFYLVESNMLLVPLSLLGPPLYTPQQPQILTYSALGFVLGHELSHGFDPEDVVLNSRGTASSTVRRELRKNRRFQRELNCLKGRFGSRLNEKFADGSGLDLAYSAYFDTAQTDGKKDRKARDSADQKQQFFLNFAQFFCSSADLSEDSADHGSDRRRVNDAVFNLHAFQEAFGCRTSQSRRQCRLF